MAVSVLTHDGPLDALPLSSDRAAQRPGRSEIPRLLGRPRRRRNGPTRRLASRYFDTPSCFSQWGASLAMIAVSGRAPLAPAIIAR